MINIIMIMIIVLSMVLRSCDRVFPRNCTAYELKTKRTW